MRITKAMVEACAAEMVKRDWLHENWANASEVCECCDQIVYKLDTDGGEDTRAQIHAFLKAALEGQR